MPILPNTHQQIFDEMPSGICGINSQNESRCIIKQLHHFYMGVFTFYNYHFSQVTVRIRARVQAIADNFKAQYEAKLK